MKKNIIFLVEKYVPEVTANVNCVQNVVNILKNNNCDITIICATQDKTKYENIDGIDINRIHFVDYSTRLRLCGSKTKKFFLRLEHFLKSVCLFGFYPNVTPIISRKIYKKLIEINKKNRIDCVISVFQPYFPIQAAKKFKKRNEKIPVIGYYLDVMNIAKKPFCFTNKSFQKVCNNIQKKDFKIFDKIFLPECSNIYYNNKEFEIYRNKIEYLNFPTLIQPKYEPKKNNKKVLTYAGTTNSLYRNPKKAIETCIKIKDKYPQLEFHLYGNSNMSEELKKIEKQSNGCFFYHGTVEKECAERAIQETDYCINFGNDLKGIVPSKVFELISTGKPIIHFTPGTSDSSLKYLKKYSQAYIIDYNSSTETIIKKIDEILKRDIQHVKFEKIEEIFYTATPKAVSEKIIKVINK